MTDCVICSALVQKPEGFGWIKVCRDCEENRISACQMENPDEETFVRGSRWKTAKTMLHIPHQYTVRDLKTPDARTSTCLDHATFEWFAGKTLSEGTREKWGRFNHAYLYVGGWKYWIMDDKVEHATIINREAVSDEAVEYMQREVARLKGR